MFLFSCCASKDASLPAMDPPVVTPMPASSVAVAQVVADAADEAGATRQPDAKDTVADAIARPASDVADLTSEQLDALGFDDDGEDELPAQSTTV
mmetsp:Transcript_24730/g.76386  ORF Transcript_24730/g.76386 Transcript_24730/m.76386 type:complete len:95 (+) Transcript_24730:74-358(+)